MIDLKDRTFKFAIDVRKFARSIRRDYLNEDDISQLVRASGSVGSNFIEAIESVSKKEFIYRIRICKKEARETAFWLKLLAKSNSLRDIEEVNYLIQEARELIMIFASIITKYMIKNGPRGSLHFNCH